MRINQLLMPVRFKKREMQQARADAVADIESEYGYYQQLWDELQGIVDQNGKIKKGYEERVAFITSTLSSALGTEISITDGVIDKYGELKTSIDQLIQKQKQEAILSAYKDSYTEAMKKQTEAQSEEAYDRDDSEYKNFAYVAWQEEGKDRIVVEVDQTNGQERRELYVDARDVNSQDEEGKPIAEATIKEQLKQRGIEALAECQVLESMTAGAISTRNLVYKKDFDLGDICPYLNQRLGISMDARITEIIETYEEGKEDLQIVFGNGQVEKIEKIIRRVMK